MRGLRTRARERALAEMAEILLTDLVEAQEKIKALQMAEDQEKTPTRTTRDTTEDGIDNQTVLVISEMPDRATVMVMSMKKSGQMLATSTKNRDGMAVTGVADHYCIVRGASVGEALSCVQSYIETEEDAFEVPDLPLDLQKMFDRYES